jgi:hypothetical protein
MYITMEKVRNNDDDKFSIINMSREHAGTIVSALKEYVKGDKYSGVRKNAAELWIEIDKKLYKD